jgi:hypothetical protein
VIWLVSKFPQTFSWLEPAPGNNSSPNSMTNRERDSARWQMEKLSAVGKFHDVPSQSRGYSALMFAALMIGGSRNPPPGKPGAPTISA